MIYSLKQLFVLTKGGIVVFVVFGGILGYALGYRIEDDFSLTHLFLSLIGLAFISAGSFVLNQVQEAKLDSQMKRTKSRPVASGWIKKSEALFLSVNLILIGLVALFLVNSLTMQMGALTIILYNGFYTLWWKKKWAFGAVPGAIPGAMPVVIGYAAVRDTVLTPECLYLFLILFLWQMPHFWAIAIKLKDDYTKGGFPVLPVVIGTERTIFHIGLYTFVYLAVAVASPWFVPAKYVYLCLVLPVVIKLAWEFIKFLRGVNGEKGWLPFFIWTNLSVIVFLAAPVIDKWIYIITYMMERAYVG